MTNNNFLRPCCMFPVVPTESQRRYLQPKDGMWSFVADRANHILDWRTSLGRFHCASALNFSVPPGKAHPDWSFMVQITGLLASPGKSPTEVKQAGHSLFRHRNQERVHKREHIKQKKQRKETVKRNTIKHSKYAEDSFSLKGFCFTLVHWKSQRCSSFWLASCEIQKQNISPLFAAYGWVIATK